MSELEKIHMLTKIIPWGLIVIVLYSTRVLSPLNMTRFRLIPFSSDPLSLPHPRVQILEQAWPGLNVDVRGRLLKVDSTYVAETARNGKNLTLERKLNIISIDACK